MEKRAAVLRFATLPVVLLAASLLGGCDVESNVSLTAVSTNGELAERVGKLEAELADERARGEVLQRELAALREASHIRIGDKSFHFRVNTQACLVLIAAILGLTAFFIARVKHATDG